MNDLSSSTQDQLVSTLNVLSVPFVNGGSCNAALLTPVELIAGLSMQDNARMRLALIPLLLSRPDLADAAAEAARHLSGLASIHLMLYYTAATCLQKIYQSQLKELLGEQPQLPEIFNRKLYIQPNISPEFTLTKLGEVHTQFTGIKANWVGTYHHGAKRLIKRLQCEIAWGIR